MILILRFRCIGVCASLQSFVCVFLRVILILSFSHNLRSKYASVCSPQFSLWIVRNNRPLTIGEHDRELRDIFEYIFQGGYVPPTYKLVVQNVLKLSVEGKEKVKFELSVLIAEGISPSIAGDIWSEGGVAIFGILAYWITKDFKYKEKLLSAIPFGDVRHNALELELATKRACADFGIGSFEEGEDKSITIDTVTDSVHATISDSASNIIKGWISFDGHECSCHLLAVSTTEYLESDGVKEVFGKMRGMTTHFNHSVIRSQPAARLPEEV